MNEEIRMTQKRVRSSDGEHDLVGRVYLPDTGPVGLFQVVHGMTEHIPRYDAFMRELAANGYIAFGYDHLGHGLTAKSDDELGFIAHKDGWIRLVDDVEMFASEMRSEYGEGLPYILMGHSMGSFIVRLTAAKYNKYDKLIVMGTGGPNPASGAGLAVIGMTKAFRGEKYISKLVYALAFGNYNDRFKDENDPNAWLTKDLSVRKKYSEDKFSTFKFTVSAMADLVRLNKFSNEKSWAASLDKNKPVFLVSGTEDPVGDNGKGVKAVFDMLEKEGVPVKMKLYENCRHEILNDTSRDEVISDILEFIKQ